MDPNDLRRRAAELLSQAESVFSEVPEGEEPSEELSQRHDALVTQADGLVTRAESLEAMAQRRAEIQARANAGPTQRADTDNVNTRNGRHKYSIGRAMGAQLRGALADGLEGEVHSDLARFRGNNKGVLVPTDTEISYRAFSAAGASTTVVRGTIQQALMARLVLAQAGVQSIVSEGLFKLPLATSGSTYWVTNTSPTAADRSIGQVAFTAHTIAAKTRIDRQTLTTANVDTEAYLWTQLTRDLAAGFQAGCFHGAGAADPKGLFAYTGGDGINVKVMGTNGGALALADLLSMTGAVATANAPDDPSWITSPGLASKLEGTVKVAGQPVYLLDPASKTLIGRPYVSTSSVSSTITKGSGSNLSALAFGAWSTAVMAMFSAIDLYANPFTGDDGGTTLSAFLDCDFALTRPSAFSICVDAATT